MAPVGQASTQRRHGPQPSATGSSVTGSSASVTTEPRTNSLPRAGEQHRAVLAVPAESRSHRRLPVDEGVVVGHDPRLPAIGSEHFGHGSQAGPEVGVVVTPRVRRDPARRPEIRRLRCGPAVRAGTHHQAAGPGQDAPWIGAPFGVPVGELHAAVKAGGLAVAQVLAGRGERPQRRRSPARPAPPPVPRRGGGRRGQRRTPAHARTSAGGVLSPSGAGGAARGPDPRPGAGAACAPRPRR